MIQQNQNLGQLPITLFNLNFSDKCSDILSFHPSLSQFHVQSFCKQQNNDQLMGEQLKNQHQITWEKGEEYFNLLFSSQVMTSCLVRRNNQLQIKCLQNQDSQPEQIYLKRKQRMNTLQQKQKKNREILAQIKIKQLQKFQALIKFMILFGQVKLKLDGLRHDYFSEKTFLSLKKASSQQIIQITKILKQILESVFQMPQKYIHHQKDKRVDQRYVEFLIIPRFFVSKQKIIRFIKDQRLQKNFQFLIYHGCLGHYNNQANKKYPEQYQMGYIRCLLQFQDGKQKFKKICGINHGGKFYRKFGSLYFELYQRSLQSLKNIDILWKKSCTEQQLREQIEKDYHKIQNHYNQIYMHQQQKQNNLFNIFNFNQVKSIGSFLYHNIFQSNQYKLTKTQSLLRATTLQLSFGASGLDSPLFKSKSKNKLRRPYSLMFENKQELELQTKFKVKRWYTLDTYEAMRALKQKNIIIIHPPDQNLFAY